MRGDVRAGKREGVRRRRRKRFARRRPDSRLGGARARAERTKNIWYMVVTLDVFQLEMSALKFLKFLKSQLISVIIETSQPAMEPYVAVAASGLALYSRTAVCRKALVVK